MDNTIRTLRLETCKRGRPDDPCCPSSTGSSQRDLNVSIPKELGLPSIEGGMLVVRIGKRRPKWQWLKDKEGKQTNKQKHKKGTKENSQTEVRNSGETNTPPSWLAQFA